MDITNYKEDLL